MTCSVCGNLSVSGYDHESLLSLSRWVSDLKRLTLDCLLPTDLHLLQSQLFLSLTGRCFRWHHRQEVVSSLPLHRQESEPLLLPLNFWQEGGLLLRTSILSNMSPIHSHSYCDSASFRGSESLWPFPLQLLETAQTLSLFCPHWWGWRRTLGSLGSRSRLNWWFAFRLFIQMQAIAGFGYSI